MSTHTSALIPLETWAYSSPELAIQGKSIDIGLFAEALLYYDSVIVNPGNQGHFSLFLKWFIHQNCIEDLYALLEDGTIKIYDYSFSSTAIKKDGTYSLWNIQDSIQSQPNSFEQRFLYHPLIDAAIPKARHRQKLYRTLQGKVIEAKSEEFTNSIENAREDYKKPERNTLIIQAFVNELYRIKRLGKPPTIESSVIASSDNSKHHITWNIDFANLAIEAGPNLGFHSGLPLTAGAHSNRLIWSASKLDCDLYLPTPMSSLVGDKIFESAERISRSGDIISSLKEEVEFPDIRNLVNSGKMNLSEVIRIRRKSKKFRLWLQDESERDRNAIIAYHHEIAKESGFTRNTRKALNLFGILGGGAIGSALGTAMAGPLGGAAAGAAGSAFGYLLDVSSALGKDWKPVVFGNWLSDHIKESIHKQ